MGVNTTYNNDSKIDGSNTYGAAAHSFPRRCMTGGDYGVSGIGTYGSRSLKTNCATSSSSNYLSARGRYFLFEYWPGATITRDTTSGSDYLGGAGMAYAYTYMTDYRVDGSDRYGQSIGFLRRCMVSAGYSNAASNCGSRCYDPRECEIYIMLTASARGCILPLRILSWGD